jgi:hypothetical protein
VIGTGAYLRIVDEDINAAEAGARGFGVAESFSSY